MRRRKNQSQRNQQLSDEELQRTQVLNLKDFKETARIERIGSKKPSAILAIMGVLLIAVGMAFPAMQSFSTRREVQAKKITLDEEKIKEVKVVEEDLSCQWEKLNNPNGTDEKMTATFHFRDNKLTSSEKAYSLTKSATAQGEPGELASYLGALQSFLMQISGYSVSVQKLDNGSITTTTVDYTLLDVTKVPAQHQANYRFDVKQKLNDSKEDVQKAMTAAGYKCE